MENGMVQLHDIMQLVQQKQYERKENFQKELDAMHDRRPREEAFLFLIDLYPKLKNFPTDIRD